MIHDRECNLPCVRKGCKETCDWIDIHNCDDGLHLCWQHIKEYEESLYQQEMKKQPKYRVIHTEPDSLERVLRNDLKPGEEVISVTQGKPRYYMERVCTYRGGSPFHDQFGNVQRCSPTLLVTIKIASVDNEEKKNP
jgi:hypothetical protein